jgi:hypothetical protein
VISKVAYLIPICLYPFISFAQVIYDGDTAVNKLLLRAYSDSILNNSQKDLNIQFFHHARLNLARPFGQNDGAMKQLKGQQHIAGLHVSGEAKHVEWSMMPQFCVEAPFREKIRSTPQLESSTLAFKNKIFNFRFSNAPFVWGVSHIDHLMMGFNAPGFKHIGLRSEKPLNIILGKLKFDLVAGKLDPAVSGGDNENAVNSTLNTSPDLGNRFFNGISVSLQPAFFKNSELGIIRQYQLPRNDLDYIPGIVNRYLPVLSGITKKSIGGTLEDSVRRDQQIAFFYILQIPTQKARLSIEYGWNDHKWHLRDLLLSWPHSAAYIISFKKLFTTSKGYDDLVVEYVNMKQQLEYTVRDAGDWYVHGSSPLGFTHKGQVLGVAAPNGIGVNKLHASFRRNIRLFSMGIGYSLIKNDHSYLAQTIWTDHVFRMSIIHRVRNYCFRFESNFVHANGYEFKKNRNWSSLQTNFSVYYKLQ